MPFLFPQFQVTTEGSMRTDRHHRTQQIKFNCGKNLEDVLAEKVKKLL